MTRILAIVAVLVVGAGAIWYATRPAETTGVEYRFVNVSKGNLESVVASTGTLDAVTTVQVGTQVSGIVNQIYVDFNDPVRRGQVIARIDTTLLASSVRDANASLVRARAQLEFNQREYDRVKELHEKGFTTEVALNQAAYNLDIAKAGIQTASISLERAQRNLSYATIISPIDGVVIERNVDEGQTVAASLSAPQLFLIANDLKRLEIQASVDEGDIGQIQPGQKARFTVQAYDNQMFDGVVRQVRLQSTVTNNVVTYTAVIDVDNADGRLLPGMTATVDFLIERVEDVYMIPNAALRFRPTERMMGELRARMEAQRAANGDSASGSRAASGGAPTGAGGGRPAGMNGGFGGASNRALLWYLDEAGQVQTVRVETGITDGSSTEIRGEGLSDGMQIVAGVTETEASGGFSNPFQSSSDAGSRPSFGRGGGF
ncbi:MAG: efflux RND transporter periplasmic adaptor subunit [Rhodothermales bacterium]